MKQCCRDGGGYGGADTAAKPHHDGYGVVEVERWQETARLAAHRSGLATVAGPAAVL